MKCCYSCGKTTHDEASKCAGCGNTTWPLDQPRTKDTAKKDDTGKRDWSLLPWLQVEQLVKVLELGATKYSRYNWQQGRGNPDFHLRVQNALLRHVVAYAQGERKDEESGFHPLAHAAVNCLFLMWYDKG